MADLERLKMKVDDAASIKSFLAMIPHAGKPRDTIDTATDKIGELNLDEKISDTKANSAETSAVESTAASNIASPQSKTSDTITPEKVSEWVHENAPADHFKSKNPLAAVQAQDSPQASGVNAPPPTPETISNLAIGQIISDELDKIPEERLLSLNDSRWAPKNASRLSNTPRHLSSSEQFLSAVPRSTKPRDDPNFTRMSFRAADTPSPPIFNVSSSETQPAVKKPLSPHAPEWAPPLKENSSLGKSNCTWPQAPPTNENDVVKTETSNKPVVALRLRAASVSEVKASKILTPKSTNEQTNGKTNGVKAEEPDIQKRKSQESPLPTDNIPHPRKCDEDADETSYPNPLFSFESSGAAFDTTEVSGGLLTPSSMTFGAVSPTKVRAAGITTANEPAKVVGEDLEGALYFKAWPKAEERGTRTAARVRKILLTGIPTSSTATDVAALVYGGPLESIAVGTSTAFTSFLHAQDADKYYEATGNDLVFKKDGVEHVVSTQMSKEVNPVSGILREYIEKEFTRCVRAIGVDKEWTMKYLHETAARKGRKVEKIIDGVNMRSVTFRFCDIVDAVKFKQTLSRAEEWEECNVHFAPDPCAEATGIHFD
ncbi:MAG: hypothetical protein Q9181_000671 [Wetmoreana brouardii]